MFCIRMKRLRFHEFSDSIDRFKRIFIRFTILDKNAAAGAVVNIRMVKKALMREHMKFIEDLRCIDS